jgi:hypothetical protein
MAPCSWNMLPWWYVRIFTIIKYVRLNYSCIYYSFKLGTCFCIYVTIEVYNTSSFILSFGWYPGFCILCTDFSEYRIKMQRKHPKERNNIHNTIKVWNTSSCLCKNIIIIMSCCIKLRMRNESANCKEKNRNKRFIFGTFSPEIVSFVK